MGKGILDLNFSEGTHIRPVETKEKRHGASIDLIQDTKLHIS
jgi:hypothetical protein